MQARPRSHALVARVYLLQSSLSLVQLYAEKKYQHAAPCSINVSERSAHMLKHAHTHTVSDFIGLTAVHLMHFRCFVFASHWVGFHIRGTTLLQDVVADRSSTVRMINS